MAQLRGYYVDLIVENPDFKEDGDFPYITERIFFTANQKKEYYQFLEDNAGMIYSKGERYS